MIKTSRNYSFKKAGDKLVGIIAETLTDMADYQNESIQRGIDTQTDIKGSKFAKLSEESTLPIRNKRRQGFTPLDRMKGARQKKLRNTKMVPAKRSTLVSQVLMLTKHGVYHNQVDGFITGKNSMIPGKKVPQREWFGVSKEMEPGGSQYKKYVEVAMFKLGRALKK